MRSSLTDHPSEPRRGFHRRPTRPAVVGPLIGLFLYKPGRPEFRPLFWIAVIPRC